MAAAGSMRDAHWRTLVSRSSRDRGLPQIPRGRSQRTPVRIAHHRRLDVHRGDLGWVDVIRLPQLQSGIDAAVGAVLAGMFLDGHAGVNHPVGAAKIPCHRLEIEALTKTYRDIARGVLENVGMTGEAFLRPAMLLRDPCARPCRSVWPWSWCRCWLRPPGAGDGDAQGHRRCSADSFSMTEAAAALPITPTSPGGWNPRRSSLAEATRMRPCTSKPVTMAVITS
jgi:hypothetical protein